MERDKTIRRSPTLQYCVHDGEGLRTAFAVLVYGVDEDEDGQWAVRLKHHRHREHDHKQHLRTCSPAAAPPVLLAEICFFKSVLNKRVYIMICRVYVRPF
jgi:hypothetical protein